MDDKHCDMCGWYDMADEYCCRYREAHYPSDGEGCPGWERYDDETFRNAEVIDG